MYLPRGIAHGFIVRKAPSVVVYQVSSEHSAAHDRGIHWDSFGAAWQESAPVVSARDQGLMPFAKFRSPFRFERAGAHRSGEAHRSTDAHPSADRMSSTR
jgi:dTDP-4-dehydrorhamnose 3,5-epimerase